jgi:hypothetical protein
MSDPSKIRIKTTVRPKSIQGRYSPNSGIKRKGLMVAEHTVLLRPKQLVIQRQWNLTRGCSWIGSHGSSSLKWRSGFSFTNSILSFCRGHLGVFGGEIFLVLNSTFFQQLPQTCACVQRFLVILGDAQVLPHKNLSAFFSFFLFYFNIFRTLHHIFVIYGAARTLAQYFYKSNWVIVFQRQPWS